MRPELGLLRLLVDIGRTGSMTATAERMAFTPSAVSQQIKRLEAIVGAPVVERHARGVTLTEAGRIVVSHAVEIETHLTAMSADLEDLSGARAGQLSLGVFPTFAASVLPTVMERFRTEHPGIELTIRSARQRDLQRMLASREVDLVLAWQYPEGVSTSPDVVSEHLVEDRTVLLVPADRVPPDATRLTTWAASPWIVRADGHPITSMLLAACRRSGFEPDVLVQANDYMETQAMVAAGLGVAVAPLMTTYFLRDDVSALDLGDDLPSRHVYIRRQARGRPSPAMAAMMAILRDVCADVEGQNL